MQDLELKIYELIGIKKFRNFTFKFRSMIYGNKLKNNGYMDNYNIGKINSLEDLEKFKKMLYMNGALHLFPILLVLSFFIFDLITLNFFIGISIVNILNLYCVILQRYNLIRVNKLIKKMNPRYELQKEEEKNCIFERINELDKQDYKVSILHNKKEFGEYLNNAKLSELKELKSSILYLDLKRRLNESINKEEDVITKTNSCSLKLSRKY